MAGLAIGMALMPPNRLGILEASVLGAILGGIGGLVGQAIAGLRKRTRLPAEPEGSDDSTAAGSNPPVASPQPSEMAAFSDLDETGPLAFLNRTERSRWEASKSAPDDNSAPDVVLAAAGVLVGLMLLAFAPMHAFVPVCAAAVIAAVAYLATAYLPHNKAFRPMVPALAVQAGHFTWLALGAAIMDQWAAVGIDLVILGAGLFWLAFRPNLGAVIFLSIYQAILLVLNALTLQACNGPVLQLALDVHMVLRAFALVALWIGWWRMHLRTQGQPSELIARVISGWGSEVHPDIDAADYEQLEPLADERKSPAVPKPATTKLAPASAGLAVGAALAAAEYGVLVAWHWTAWWMLAICLALVVASLVTFVVYQYQGVQRRTATGDALGYVGLAANVVSLILVACVVTAAAVTMPTVAKKPAAQQPSLGVTPPPRDSNKMPSLPQENVDDRDRTERIRKMLAEARAKQAADQARMRADHERWQQENAERAAEKARHRADFARKRQEEEAAALKPRWRPFEIPTTPSGRTGPISYQPETIVQAQQNLVQWKRGENGFRITSLRMPRHSASTQEGNHVAWSGDGRRLYTMAELNYVYEISVGDWTVRRRLRIWPPAKSICFCKDSLLVARETFVNQFSNFQVLTVDPKTLSPAEELDLPAALRIRDVSGSAGCKYLFAIDQGGQMLTAIDLAHLDAGNTDREAKLTRIPLSHAKQFQGWGELGVTPDGKTAIYHEWNNVVLLSIGKDGSLSTRQVPDGPCQEVHTSANSQSLVSQVGVSSPTGRGSWQIHDLPDLQKSLVTLPLESRCPRPDVDPVSGAILTFDNHVFSALDRLGNERKSLPLGDAIQRSGARISRSRSRLMAHPQGNRCLLLGSDWAVWLEWDDDGKPTGPAKEQTPLEAVWTRPDTRPTPNRTESPQSMESRIQKVLAWAAEELEKNRKQAELENAWRELRWQPLNTQPKPADSGSKNLVQAKTTQNGFRITRLNLCRDIPGASAINDFVAWSADGQRMFFAGDQTRQLREISLNDWTVNRSTLLPGRPRRVIRTQKSLVVACDLGNTSQDLVLVDPATMIANAHVILPTAGAICGSPASEVLYVIDADATTAVRIYLDTRKVQRQAFFKALTPQQQSDLRRMRGLQELVMTADGTHLVYCDQVNVDLIELQDHRIRGGYTAQRPVRERHVLAGPDPKRFVCGINVGKGPLRQQWGIYEAADQARPLLNLNSASRALPPALDPVSGGILVVDKNRFRVLDNSGKMERFLLDPSRELIVDGSPDIASYLPSRPTNVLAHPQGNRALIVGEDSSTWLQWDAEDKAKEPAKKTSVQDGRKK